LHRLVASAHPMRSAGKCQGPSPGTSKTLPTAPEPEHALKPLFGIGILDGSGGELFFRNQGGRTGVPALDLGPAPLASIQCTPDALSGQVLGTLSWDAQNAPYSSGARTRSQTALWDRYSGWFWRGAFFQKSGGSHRSPHTGPRAGAPGVDSEHTRCAQRAGARYPLLGRPKRSLQLRSPNTLSNRSLG